MEIKKENFINAGFIDNEYLQKMIDIVQEKCSEEEKFFEYHHIIPKSLGGTTVKT